MHPKLSSPNDGLLELVGHDELDSGLHPHLGVSQLQIHGWQPGRGPVGLQLLGRRGRYKVCPEIEIGRGQQKYESNLVTPPYWRSC